MTENDLMDLICAPDTPSHGLPCMMADGKVALLIINPTVGQVTPRYFGLMIPGEEDIRWRAPECIVHLGGGALSEVSP